MSVEQSINVAEKLNREWSQVVGESKEQEAQGAEMSSGRSSQVPEKSSLQSNIIKEPRTTLTEDDKLTFYVNQLKPSNIEQIKDIINLFLKRNFTNFDTRLLKILLMKGITDQTSTELIIQLINFYCETKSIRKELSPMLTESYINIRKERQNQEQKMMSFVKITIAVNPFLKRPFWHHIFGQLYDDIKLCTSAFKALVQLMSFKLEILNKTKKQKKFMSFVVAIFRHRLASEKDKDLIDKMNIIIAKVEEEETNQKPARKPKRLFSLSPQIYVMPSVVVDPSLKDQEIYTKILSSSNQNFIQIHPYDAARFINSTSNTAPSTQHFMKVLQTLCEACIRIENNKEAPIKIKEFIAFAIIEINVLKTQPKPKEVNEYTEMFYELYGKLSHNRFLQWILVKFLKAWKLYDQTNVDDSKKLDEKIAKIYDGYSKSVLRVLKSYEVSTPATINIDIEEKIANKVLNDNITSKSDNIIFKEDNIALKSNSKSSTSENLQLQPCTSRYPEQITSNLGLLTTKPKSTTTKSKTITLVFEDMVPKSDKSSTSSLETKSKAGDLTSIMGTTSKSKNINSISCNSTSCFDVTTKFIDLSLKSNDQTSKLDINSKSGDLTSKLDSITSTFGLIASKSIDQPPKSLPTKFFNIFMTSLKNILTTRLTSNQVDLNDDPLLKNFIIEKRQGYEIICDLHFHDLITTDFIFDCIKKMFEHPVIIEKCMDVAVKLMVLVETMISIKHDQNDFKYFFTSLRVFWNQLPPKIELQYPISVDKWTRLNNFIQNSLLFRLNFVGFQELIKNLWTDLLDNPDRFSDVVQVFENFLQVLGDNFVDLVKGFMEYQRSVLEKFPADYISKEVSQKYKTSILFAFELFGMGALNCESFVKWLNDDVYGKLVAEHSHEILVKLGQKGLKIDENLDENLKVYHKKNI